MDRRDLITIADLSNQEIEEIFSLADEMNPTDSGRVAHTMEMGKIMATLFYEPSTRTRLSFESAMHRLGGAVISCPDMKSSSATKGESIADTAKVVSSYADLLVIRHYWDGAVKAMAEHADVPIINAGDGSHEHPTQTLCDLYTLRKEKGKLNGLTVVICGDMKHGRTIHSLVYALARFGAHVIILAAPGMEIPQYVIERLDTQFHYSPIPVISDDLKTVVTSTDAVYLSPSQPHQLALFTQANTEIHNRLNQMATGRKLDAFYVTRQQKERGSQETTEGQSDYPRIDERFLKAKGFKETLVMHPLPRVDELAPEVDKDPRGIYFKQAAYGVPVRMALIKFLLDRFGAGKSKRPAVKLALYQSPEPSGPRCTNANCVTHNEPGSTQAGFEILFTSPVSGLFLRCLYCDHQLKIRLIGHSKSKRYCSYDLMLEETARSWIGLGELSVFDSIKQAEELGYEPYKSGPQRSVMDESEIQAAIDKMTEEIQSETKDLNRLLVLGIRTKGVYIAKRVAARMEEREGRNIEMGEVEVYSATGEEPSGPSIMDSDGAPINLQGRSVVLVDDVIHTGRTVKRALSIVFKSGRPESVRLAVLIDRGHREVPVKPNYIGKNIPSSQRERVRVKLREVEKGERDKVVIYSLINPTKPGKDNVVR